MHRRLFHINAVLTSLSHLTHPTPELCVRKETQNFHLASSPRQLSTSQQNGNHPGFELSDLRASPGSPPSQHCNFAQVHFPPVGNSFLVYQRDMHFSFLPASRNWGENKVMNKEASKVSEVRHTRINVIIIMYMLAIMSKHLISSSQLGNARPRLGTLVYPKSPGHQWCGMKTQSTATQPVSTHHVVFLEKTFPTQLTTTQSPFSQQERKKTKVIFSDFLKKFVCKK